MQRSARAISLTVCNPLKLSGGAISGVFERTARVQSRAILYQWPFARETANYKRMHIAYLEEDDDLYWREI